MRCPYCHNQDTDVIDTRRLNEGDAIRRRRKCRICARRFTTYERVETVTITVVKKNGEREPFDREKLMRGVRTACYRRPVATPTLEQLVSDVETALLARDEQEVPSSAIGDIVMTRLRDLDEVAYIRFASVYRSFTDLGKLREAVDELLVNEAGP
ncbi:MAG: transcriptional repressor NrdR [Chloroflexales bacterium]|nr:transcriptional repressor NrdR [Chloroflexales bacterium]